MSTMPTFSNESQYVELKSIRVVTGTTVNWQELAKDCVCFANARGGLILIGIEDGQSQPPEDQKLDQRLPSNIRKRIADRTINVATTASIISAENGGEYVELKVLPSISTIASTTDGRYYYRISDHCIPLPPEDLLRLLTDKPAFNWEAKALKSVSRLKIDPEKLKNFVTDIRNSSRVSEFVKQKSPDELLDYFLMAEDQFLTNLGVLWVGKREDRARLLYAPVIQFIKFDQSQHKVNKIVWDDFSLNPKELIEAVWTQIPDWKEGIEVSDGLFRKFIPDYEEEIIRELIANALVHRPYTTRGDIFINLYPDRLEVHNPGLLPVGVTPENILHKTVRRNEHLAKVFHDLILMEREGSGFDKMYEILLSNGKQQPMVEEGDDRVKITIHKRITKNEIVSLINRVNEQYQLRQRELICLGLIAINTSLSALEFARVLNLSKQNEIREWMGRLPELEIIKSKGKTKGMEYYINPVILKNLRFTGKTTLKKIEDHRLRELLYQDLTTYSNSAISEIHERVGMEIPSRRIKLQLDKMVATEEILAQGMKRWRRYSINKNK